VFFQLRLSGFWVACETLPDLDYLIFRYASSTFSPPAVCEFMYSRDCWLAAFCPSRRYRPETQQANADSVVRLFHPTTAGPSTPARQLVRDAARWRAAWSSGPVHETASEAPALDFSRQMVVIAAIGSFPSTGYYVFVDSVRSTLSDVLVYVRSVSPKGCAVGAAERRPIDIVRVPLAPLPARFIESTEVERCE
jgi:hypothetical protein